MYQNLVRSVAPDSPVSIHLTNYPTANPDQIDLQLSNDMAAVLEVVSAGHAARQEAAVKVRQPLPAILVYTRQPEAMAAIVRLKDQVLDELNVKDLAPLTDPGEVVAYDIRPNLRLLGPKYGKRLGAIRAALANEDPASVAQRVEAGATIDLQLADGESVALEPAEILVDLTKRAGYAAAQSANMTVVLDTALSPELLQEGLARDFVRGIQDARKQAGYKIEDTIAIWYDADPEVVRAVKAHQAFISHETLAASMDQHESIGASDALDVGNGKTGDDTYRDQIEVGQHRVTIALKQMATA
jgi:isoleucyl-tRNA synthetase